MVSQQSGFFNDETPSIEKKPTDVMVCMVYGV